MRSTLIGTCGVLAIAGVAVSGCSAGKPLSVSNAFLPVPDKAGVTVGYLEIRNNGSADELVSVQTSAGGTVSLRAPDEVDGTVTTATHAVTDIPIPADSTVHLSPDTYHLLITGVPSLPGGKAITLKLTFAHGGTFNVIALVTDASSGGSSYFLN